VKEFMVESLITLTTDFGESSPYVAALKGVILGIHPAVQILDLSHQIPPQDLGYAAFFLKNAIPFFPTGVIHLVVVDPGVGSNRALLYVETDRHRLLVPDNGCWALLASACSSTVVRRLDQPAYRRPEVSATFHGRDILAPAAAWLSRGLNPELLGPITHDWIRFELPAPLLERESATGEVIFVDHFGNLITNIPGDVLRSLASRPLRITVGREPIARAVRTYADADAGAPVALVSSSDLVEIAVNHGNAARQLGATIGTAVTINALP
jgi:S-adenosylmethionine hydrolase